MRHVWAGKPVVMSSVWSVSSTRAALTVHPAGSRCAPGSGAGACSGVTITTPRPPYDHATSGGACLW